jgi:phosphoglucosamine mutase
MKRLPQVLINVKDVDKGQVEGNAVVQAEVRSAQAELDGVGRVLLRKSGTEPLVRVMVEADDEARAQAVAQRLAVVVAKNLAL